MPELSDDGKEQVALALLLLKDFKRQEWIRNGAHIGPGDEVEIMAAIIGLVDHLGVRKQFSKLLSKVPPMKTTPRDK